jgi:hypothetical protein
MDKILDWLAKLASIFILVILGLPLMLLMGVVALFLGISDLIEQIWNRG